MSPKRVVIVGGGGTGDYAAFTLRKKGFEGEIAILSADRDRPYDRPYLSKEFLRGEIDAPKVFLHDEADYGRERVDLRLAQRPPSDPRVEPQVDALPAVIGLGGTPR